LQNRLTFLRRYVRAFGPPGLLFALRAKTHSSPIEVEVKPRGLPAPVRLRWRTADFFVYEQIFVKGEYRFDFGADVRTVVDAGAHVGLAAAYFAATWPDATILALEPEGENFSLLAKTAIGYPGIIPINAALWRSECALHVIDPGAGNWAYQTQETSNAPPASSRGVVRGMTIDGLMNRYGLDFIDLLKIDIEGAEKEVFDPVPRWMGRVGAIIIELHERRRPECGEAFYAAVRDEFPFEYRQGENVVVSRYEVRGRRGAARAWSL
jgi:FkbM family methyltransferase